MENILLILNTVFVLSLPLLAAWLLDRWLGDPAWLPHPVVAFGKMISFCEHLLNKGSRRGLKGAFVAIVLVLAVYFAAYYLFPLDSVIFSGTTSGTTDTYHFFLSGGYHTYP